MSILPRNPYITGRALNDAYGFFGRQDVFDFVCAALSSPDQNSVVLSGRRRIGKTSILLNLPRYLPDAQFVPVYFDLMDRARKSLADVLLALAETISERLELILPSPAMFDEKGSGFRDKFLPHACRALQEDQRLVLLFDEFDVLDIRQEEELAPTAAARALFPYLRRLMIDEPRVSFVFVVGRKAADLGMELKATFKSSRYYPISVLDRNSAIELVRSAEREQSLYFADAAVERILALTGRHPFFTQLVCKSLFEKLYFWGKPPASVPTITAADVDKIVPVVIETSDNVFEWIWDGLSPAEHFIFSSIAAGTSEATTITEKDLVNILQRQEIRGVIQARQLTPAKLTEHDVLTPVDGGFRFFIELMRRWVVERKPPSKAMGDLDRAILQSATWFENASQAYRNKMYGEAMQFLQQALELNPNHVSAYLLLGEIHRIHNRLDDAVQALLEAYHRDDERASAPLQAALMQRAHEHEEHNRVDEAWKDYSQILLINPDNPVVQEKRDTIVARRQTAWLRKGEQALQANDLGAALLAFSEAGARDQAAYVEALQTKLALKKNAELATKLEHWDEAVKNYQQLATLYPSEKGWRRSLERAQRAWQKASEQAQRKQAGRWWIGWCVASMLGGALGGFGGGVLGLNNGLEIFVALVMLFVGLVVGGVLGSLLSVGQWLIYGTQAPEMHRTIFTSIIGWAAAPIVFLCAAYLGMIYLGKPLSNWSIGVVAIVVLLFALIQVLLRRIPISLIILINILAWVLGAQIGRAGVAVSAGSLFGITLSQLIAMLIVHRLARAVNSARD